MNDGGGGGSRGDGMGQEKLFHAIKFSIFQENSKGTIGKMPTQFLILKIARITFKFLYYFSVLVSIVFENEHVLVTWLKLPKCLFLCNLFSNFLDSKNVSCSVLLLLQMN